MGAQAPGAPPAPAAAEAGVIDAPPPTVTATGRCRLTAYDEAWRMVANFRESDTAPKEDWVNHLAAYDRLGGSTYINGVVLRDKDANTDWTSASDGTLERRVYHGRRCLSMEHGKPACGLGGRK